MGLTLIAARLLNRKIPLNAVISLTRRCTSACAYCYSTDPLSREMSTDEIRDVLDQLAGLGCQSVSFNGGEPLVREDVGDILSHAKRRKLFVHVNSNGHLLPEKQDVLSFIDHLHLSLDGPEAMHDRNRGAGSYKKVMRAIELSRGKTLRSTETVLAKHNIEGVDFVLATARRCGMRARFLLLHGPASALLPGDKEYRTVIQKLIHEKTRGAPVASSIRTLEYLLRWPDFSKDTLSYGLPSGPERCWAGKLSCFIAADGRMYPCCLTTGKTPALNCLQEGVQAAFDGIGGSVPCRSCNLCVMLEMNYLYSLDGAVILDEILSGSNDGKPARFSPAAIP